MTNSARISSTDGLPAVSSDTVNVSAFTATALPSPQTYTQTVTYTAATSPSSATGSVTFSIGGTTLCTATLPTLSCTATNAPVGADTVTATYSGDSNFAPQTTTTTLTITKATPTFTEAAAPSSIVYGSQDTLSDSGLPGWRDRHRDVQLGRLDAVRRDHPGDELPDRDARSEPARTR